jgi:hypothetical protein
MSCRVGDDSPFIFSVAILKVSMRCGEKGVEGLPSFNVSLLLTLGSESCFFSCLGRVRQAYPSAIFSFGSCRAEALLLSCARSVEQ